MSSFLRHGIALGIVLALSPFLGRAEESVGVTGMTVSQSEVTLQWSGGKAPYSIQSSVDLSDWKSLEETSETEVSIPRRSDEGAVFLRILSSPDEPALGEYVGQLRVDEGGEHRMRPFSIWIFQYRREVVPVHLPRLW